MKRLIAIQQALKVTKSKDGYGYKYRDAEQILAAAKDALAANKCAIVCDAEYITIDGALFKKVTANLIGEDGKTIASASDVVKSPTSMKGMVEQQVSGSDTTYCKRYALQNLLAIDDGDMDIDCKTNPANPKNTAKAAAAKPQVQAPQAPKMPVVPTTNKVSKMDEEINAIKSAVELQAMQNRLNAARERLGEDGYQKWQLKLVEKGRTLKCTYTDAEGWVSDDDLFGDNNISCSDDNVY